MRVQLPTGALVGEGVPEQIRRVYRVLAADRGAPIRTRLHRVAAELANQVGDQADAAEDAVTVQRGGDPPTAERRAR